MSAEFMDQSRAANSKRPGGLTATELARRLQTVGREIMASGHLLEVEENLFSTCQEQVSNLGDRLIRARDTNTPLVEVSLSSETKNYAALHELFGSTGRLVFSVLTTNGLEDNSGYGKEINYDELSLSIPGHHTVAVDGRYGSMVSAVLNCGTYLGYETTGTEQGSLRSVTPLISSHYLHELAGGRTPHYILAAMHETLKIALEDFQVANLRDGSVDSD